MKRDSDARNSHARDSNARIGSVNMARHAFHWQGAIAAFAAIMVLCSMQASAADTIRVCTYNVLKYSLANEDGRVPMFHMILDSIRPDIMVCQEVEDATLGPRFISDVLTYAPFASSPFIDGPDTDNQLLYDQSKFTFLGQRRITTSLRDIAEFTVATVPTNGVQPDTIVMYSCHLKASDGSSEASQRAAEVFAMMSSMTTQRYALICGDMNMYGPNEEAYNAITSVFSVRRFVDPIGQNWTRNTAAHAAKYTQCTRATTLGACGGGVDGGMDDRFDYVFVSEALESRVVPGTYKPFGNDGVARLNASIDEPPNTLVSAAMAAALKCASDHLPLTVDIVVGETPAGVDADVVEVVPPIRIAPNPSTDRIVVSNTTPGVCLRMFDAHGKLVYDQYTNQTEVVIAVDGLPAGRYLMRYGQWSHSIMVAR